MRVHSSVISATLKLYNLTISLNVGIWWYIYLRTHRLYRLFWELKISMHHNRFPVKQPVNITCFSVFAAFVSNAFWLHTVKNCRTRKQIVWDHKDDRGQGIIKLLSRRWNTASVVRRSKERNTINNRKWMSWKQDARHSLICLRPHIEKPMGWCIWPGTRIICGSRCFSDWSDREKDIESRRLLRPPRRKPLTERLNFAKQLEENELVWTKRDPGSVVRMWPGPAQWLSLILTQVVFSVVYRILYELGLQICHKLVKQLLCYWRYCALLSN